MLRSSSLLRSTILAAGVALAAGAVVSASPAAAQGYRPYPGPYGYNAPPSPYPPEAYGPQEVRRLSPSAIVDRLDDQGYDDIGRPRYTGTLYIVQATAPGGMRMQLVVDAVRGVVLNRTSLGRRGDDDDDDDVRLPGRRYGGRPGAPFPDEMPSTGSRGTIDTAPPEYRERREAARPQVTVPSVTGPEPLPAPTDRRLAPGEAARPFEGRVGNREAARVQPDVRPPAGDRVEGTNPEAAPVRRKPTQGARKPTTLPPADPAPNAAASPAAPDATAPRPTTAPPRATAEARQRPSRPVRVIEGVTPMNSGNPGASQLETLPAPPPVAPPTTVQ